MCTEQLQCSQAQSRIQFRYSSAHALTEALEETVQTIKHLSSGQWVEAPTQSSQQERSIEREPEVSSCKWFTNEKPIWLQELMSNHTAIHTSQKPAPMGAPPTTPHQLHYFQLDLFDTPSLTIGPVSPSGVSVDMAYGSRGH